MVDATSEVEAVRAAARWTVGAAAALLAAMLAGVQLSAVGRLEEFTAARGGGSVIAATAGLLGAGAVLWLAARVLVSPGWTLNRLAGLELTAPETWRTHWARLELESRQALLSPTRDLKLAGLYRHQRALFVASVELSEHGRTTVAGSLLDGEETTYRADHQGDEDRLNRRRALADALAARIVETIDVADTHRRYRVLVRALPWLGATAVLSIAAFIWATSPPVGVPVTAPTPVRVEFAGDRAALAEAGVPDGCAGVVVAGVAVGGTLVEPVVSSVERADCRVDRVRLPKRVAVVVPTTK
ncbi:hypothetical protein GCM10022243_29030 [Saccharothrix violaceirubra]